METYSFRLLKEQKAALKKAAKEHAMTLPNYVRAILALAVNQQIRLTLAHDNEK